MKGTVSSLMLQFCSIKPPTTSEKPGDLWGKFSLCERKHGLSEENQHYYKQHVKG